MWNVPNLSRNKVIDLEEDTNNLEYIMNDENNSLLGVSRLEIRQKEQLVKNNYSNPKSYNL